ncbi:F-box protein At5g49610-like [Rosa rugosa]|uniref:F-box protein At5g49610-like n=1 Tax=Rosa rugosa TaxID=74645 RepID=UPI002B40D65F|nr:F-box protein At5g49610-like [Rosa rugosa]
MEAGSSNFLAVADESVLVEILSKLPLKSIYRFRCVSKEWNALTRTSYFLDRHRLHSSRRLLLISSSFLADQKPAGISLLADEETALSSLNIPFLPNDARWDLDFVGSSNGLVCCNKFLDGNVLAIIVWNPATTQFSYHRHSFEEELENATSYPLIGFDFMHSTNVYKMVEVFPYGSDDPDDPLKLDFGAAVFTQNTPSWRVVESRIGLASCKMCYTNQSTTLNGVLYWLVEHTSNGFAVVSFSLHDEAFKDICKSLPEEIRYVSDNGVFPTLVSWRNSLAVVGVDQGDNLVLWVDSTADQESDWIEQMRIRWPSLCEGSWLLLRGVWKDQFVFSKKGYEVGAHNEPDNLFLYNPITEALRKRSGIPQLYM